MAGRAGSEAGRLALLGLPFFAYAFLEMAVIIWAANWIGWWTLLAMGASAAVGVYLLQREGRKALGALMDTTRTGHLPPGKMADTTLILLGAILLVVPGFITDLIGLSLVLPFTRPFIRSAMAWWAARALRRSNTSWSGTIEGEVVETHEETAVRPVLDLDGYPGYPQQEDPPDEGSAR